MGEWIDLKTWNRREHYRLFRSYKQPFFSVTVDVDVTALWKQCRSTHGSFFLTTLFLMLKAVNRVEAFRLRLRPRGVWRHDRVAAGPTVLRADGTFAFTRVEAFDDFDEFITRATIATSNTLRDPRLRLNNTSDDIVFHSVLPWLRFTAFTNALPGGDSIPRIVFGRCTGGRGRIVMPVAIEVHHAIVDGRDVARFVDAFEALCRLPREREQRAAKRHVGIAKRNRLQTNQP